MIALSQVEAFDWDDGNRQKNLEKHGVTALEAEQVFFNQPLVLIEDEKHSGDEQRFHAFGTTDEGRLLHIAFTLRRQATLLRVISARDMNRKERQSYAKEA